MISFLLCLALLIMGYFVYGKIVDNTFGPDDREDSCGADQRWRLTTLLCRSGSCFSSSC